MKKSVSIIVVTAMVLCNALVVNASENLDRFEKAMEGTWTQVTDVRVGGIDHNSAFTEELVLPNDNIVLTEDSTGLVYVVAANKDNLGSPYDITTMGIITLSSDNNTMAIQDPVGGFLVYERK